MKFYKSSIGRCFILFSLIPVILITVLMTYISMDALADVKEEDAKNMLAGVARELEYSYVNDTDDVDLHVDRMKELFDTDASIFIEDTRIMTTIINDDGSRYIGTKSSDVWNDYVSVGEDYFSSEVNINEKEYYGYYTPIYDEAKNIIGMAFAGVPIDYMEDVKEKLNVRFITIAIIFCMLAFIMSSIVAGYLLNKQNYIMSYLRDINRGEFDHEISPKLAKRKDEYGVMTRYISKFNNSLKHMVQNDSLTGLLNRGAAMRELEQYVSRANCVDGETFTLAIGDIDFFKKVNDTYGHNCGDEVLKEVSKILGVVSPDEGFVARWGGEEFILVFRGKLAPALEKLENIADKIRNKEIIYEKDRIKVTMTFGISEYIAPKKLDWVITNADSLLYRGKESGRNTIVS